MSKLIFFDVNGTLIEKDKRTDEAYERAIDSTLKVTNSLQGVDNTARSDKDVFMEVVDKYNLEFTEELWDKFLTIYDEKLREYMEDDIWRENVDAGNFLEKLSNSSTKISIITGELSIGAQYKLSKVGFWEYFNTGGFGEDALTRFGIGERALEKSKKLYGEEFDEIYVIGDTILDIKTARHINAKIISITTGSYTREELEKEDPDYIIDRFSEIESLFF